MKNRFDKRCEIEGKKPRYTDDFHDRINKSSKKQKQFSIVLYTGIAIVAIAVVFVFLYYGAGGNAKSSAKSSANGVDMGAVGAGIAFIIGAILMVVGGFGYTDEEPPNPTEEDFVGCG